VLHVGVVLRPPNKRHSYGSRRSYRHAKKRERENEVTQSAKQAHGGNATDAARSWQPLRGPSPTLPESDPLRQPCPRARHSLGMRAARMCRSLGSPGPTISLR
jgi:hypothetical protein